MADSNRTTGCGMHEALVSHLYGEATPEESRLVEAHTIGCAVCADELSAFERVRGMLQTWQVTELPEVSFVKQDQKRRSIAAFKDLFTNAPLWLRAIGGVTVALMVLAVMGTTITVGNDGVSLSFGLLRGKTQPQQTSNRSSDEIRAELKTLVNAMIAESEREQSEFLRMQLVSLESQLQNIHATDLAKLSARIQQQRNLIKALERDIDRREGLALTDLLFSEAIGPSDDSIARTPDSDE